MESGVRVCPFCGEPPGPGTFCEACGRNLAAVERLPTAAEWAAGNAEDPGPRAQDVVVSFLTAMRAAGEPGTKALPTGPPNWLGRTRKIRGWIVRPVEREDFTEPKRYVPGLLLALDGRFHQLDSELRGFGQRDFPHYHHTVAEEPVSPELDARLVEELAAVRAANGLPGP